MEAGAAVRLVGSFGVDRDTVWKCSGAECAPVAEVSSGEAEQLLQLQPWGWLFDPR